MILTLVKEMSATHNGFWNLIWFTVFGSFVAFIFMLYVHSYMTHDEISDRIEMCAGSYPKPETLLECTNTILANDN